MTQIIKYILYRQGEEWYRPRRVLSRKMLPLNEVLAYIDVMDQVADDFIERLRRVRHQLSDLTDASSTLEHELFKFAIECMCSFTAFALSLSLNLERSDAIIIYRRLCIVSTKWLLQIPYVTRKMLKHRCRLIKSEQRCTPTELASGSESDGLQGIHLGLPFVVRHGSGLPGRWLSAVVWRRAAFCRLEVRGLVSSGRLTATLRTDVSRLVLGRQTSATNSLSDC